jgi:hypothetical protein
MKNKLKILAMKKANMLKACKKDEKLLEIIKQTPGITPNEASMKMNESTASTRERARNLATLELIIICSYTRNKNKQKRKQTPQRYYATNMENGNK